jgi:hypothetical protein
MSRTRKSKSANEITASDNKHRVGPDSPKVDQPGAHLRQRDATVRLKISCPYEQERVRGRPLLGTLCAVHRSDQRDPFLIGSIRRVTRHRGRLRAGSIPASTAILFSSLSPEHDLI